MSSPLGVAIFGLGRAGMIHLGNILANPVFVLHYIVDSDVEKAQSIVDQYRLNVTVLKPDQADTVYSDVSICGVVICTPTDSHEDFVRGALKNGKGVFCEKPIAGDTQSTWMCYKEAEEAGRPLVCSFNRRFDPGLIAVRNRLQAGDIGAVHTIHTVARDHPLPPMAYLKISGGIFHDCAVHDIDLVCWMLGELPSSVSAEAWAHNEDIRGLDDVDTVAITMRFPSNIISTIQLSRLAKYGYDQRIEVFGVGGMIQNNNQQPTGVTLFNSSGLLSDPLLWSFPQRYRESYTNALQHFADVLSGDAKVSVSGNATLAAIIIATACEEAHQTGRKINLDLQHLLSTELAVLDA